MASEHWDQIFKKNMESQLGWYENDLSQTLKFIKQIPDCITKTIFISGAGTSQLVDHFIGKCHHLILNDVSAEALKILRARLGDTSQLITWIHSDISGDLPIDDSCIDVWIDRAVLHFLTTENQIQNYFKNIHNKVNVGGRILLAEFSENGALKCAGLDVRRYSLQDLSVRLGESYKLLDLEYFTYFNPKGDPRPYIYAFYQKQ